MRACGRAGVWACGCAGVWACGSAAVRACLRVYFDYVGKVIICKEFNIRACAKKRDAIVVCLL